MEKPEIYAHFTYEHLPQELQDISCPYCEAAREIWRIWERCDTFASIPPSEGSDAIAVLSQLLFAETKHPQGQQRNIAIGKLLEVSKLLLDTAKASPDICFQLLMEAKDHSVRAHLSRQNKGLYRATTNDKPSSRPPAIITSSTC